MRHANALRHATLLATLALPWTAGAADVPAAQAYAPAYFSQFQPSNAMDMVARLPGFVFDGGNAARGVAGNVFINGKRPTSKTESVGDALGRIPAAAVQRIEVINSSAAGLDLQGYPSVANLVLKEMDLVSANATAATYLTPDGRLQPGIEGNYNLKRGDKSVNLSMAWTRTPDSSQAHGHRSTLPTGAAAPAEVDIAAVGAAERKSLKFNYGQDLLDGQLTWNGALSPWTYQSQAHYDGAATSRNNNDNGGHTREQGLAYSRDLAHGASMDLRALYRSADAAAVASATSSGNTTYTLTATTATEQLLSGQLSWQALDGVLIRGGVERALNTNDSASSYQSSPGAALSPNGAAWVQEERMEAQLSSTWQPDSALSAEAGLKLEHSSLTVGADQPDARAYLYPKPRLRLALSPTPSLQLRLRMEREVSQLNFNDGAAYFGIDRSLRAGHPDLVPAKTWLCEGALEYRFWERGSAVLSYTQSHISDVIDRAPIRTASATYDAAGNIGDADAGNLTGLLNLPTDSWALPQGMLKLSTTLRSSFVTDPTTLSTRRLSGEQALAWRVEFTQDLPRQQTAWGFSVDNGWSNDSWQVAERDTSSGTGWARAFVNYRPAYNLTLTLELNNLASRVISYDRVHSAGDRLAGGVDLVEHNITRTQPFALLKLRTDW